MGDAQRAWLQFETQILSSAYEQAYLSDLIKIVDKIRERHAKANQEYEEKANQLDIERKISAFEAKKSSTIALMMQQESDSPSSLADLMQQLEKTEKDEPQLFLLIVRNDIMSDTQLDLWLFIFVVNHQC